MGTAAAAAVLLRREREIVRTFRAAGAVTPEKAQSREALNVHDGLAWRLLKGHAVIRTASPNLFYLDELSWEASRSFRRKILYMMIALLFLLIALGVVTIPQLQQVR